MTEDSDGDNPETYHRNEARRWATLAGTEGLKIFTSLITLVTLADWRDSPKRAGVTTSTAPKENRHFFIRGGLMS